MIILDAPRRITEEVQCWPDVVAGFGDRGEYSLRVGRRELGHLHNYNHAHFSFPKAEWHRLVAEGRIIKHRNWPEAVGPGERKIRTEEDVADIIILMRANYDRIQEGREHEFDGEWDEAFIWPADDEPADRGAAENVLTP